MCKWAHLVIPSIYSVFVYHRYINANIGPWWIWTWLNIFPIPKHQNFSSSSSFTYFLLFYILIQSFLFLIFNTFFFFWTVDSQMCIRSYIYFVFNFHMIDETILQDDTLPLLSFGIPFKKAFPICRIREVMGFYVAVIIFDMSNS